MRWLISNVAGGIVRWTVGTILTLLFLMWGLTPTEVVKELWGNPPVWVLHPWTRLGMVAIGVLVALLLIWLHSRARHYVITPDGRASLLPDIDAAEGFKQILSRSKWAKRRARHWRTLLQPVTFEKDRPESEVVEDRLIQALDREIHDHLRQERLTAWGRLTDRSRPGSGPERRIDASEWDTIDIEFDKRSLERTPANTCASKRERERSFAYVQVRFSSRELKYVYPFAWYSRGILTQSLGSSSSRLG